MNHPIQPVHTPRFSEVIDGQPHEIGTGFTARHFSEEMFGTSMDPLLMVDHFVMTAPTFAPHLHAGMSAVTVMFEDAQGDFINRDSLGNTVALRAGDTYWLAAANGAVHEERPAEGARVHALQLFVNLPARLKHEPARTLHVQRDSVPILAGDRHRVRVVLGHSGAVNGAQGTPEPITLLDGHLLPGGRFEHLLPTGHQAWIYAVSGNLEIAIAGERRAVAPGQAITLSAGASAAIALQASEAAHFVLIAARPISEAFVKYGPLVMSTEAEVRSTLESHARGEFGRVPA
ncbi:pirin family protein [Pseudomonas putida]|uniref:pirin family protein n=1 Tax=Pseudomonas putida TaxID=303 RepID=UPI00383AF17C